MIDDTPPDIITHESAESSAELGAIWGPVDAAGGTSAMDEVKALGKETMIEEIGEDAVKSRVRCATLALGTAQAAVDSYIKTKRSNDEGIDAGPVVERFEN